MTTHQKTRILYIDNIRILLITLIVLLHCAITYGAPGSWYINEVKFEEIDFLCTVVYGLFNATVQAFSLGFFFLISAYFTTASYDRKGVRKFLTSRFRRLGIPLLFQIIVIQPVLVNTLWGSGKPFLRFYVDYFIHLRTPGVGPLWFIEALLIFSVFYINAPVLIFLALALKNITLYPLLKFIIVAPVAVSLCFVTGTLVRKLPYAREIL